MCPKELPVLNFAAFRRYPTKQGRQEYGDYGEVCRNCVSGGCCSSEDPIYLTSFDLFRLAAFFNMSLAQFMLNFTQERFGDPETDRYRRHRIDDPNSSVVTFLRRRELLPSSPCIFLKYVRDPDGTPRRICSVHDGRPLACREFYYSHCRGRVTGELASLQAEGFEKLRDEEITEELVDTQLERFGAFDPYLASLARSLEYFFWIEMKRAINMDQANVEGANSYDMADFQDPIDEKLNRVLSAKHLRFEEKYGPRPRDEQLTPYTEGLRFAGSAEYERIMTVIGAAPSTGLYATGNYPFDVGLRTTIPGVKSPPAFPVIPDAEINHFIRSLPEALLFPHNDMAEARAVTLRDVYASVLKGYNHLIRFASYLATMEDIFEDYEPGSAEADMFLMIAGFETSLNPFIARNPYLQAVKYYMAKKAVGLIEKRLVSATSPKDLFASLRFLCSARSSQRSLPADLRARFRNAISNVDAGLEKEELSLYLSLDNPVAARQQAGKRLNISRAWNEWYDQAVDMRYAYEAGFPHIDLPAFYRKSLSDLEKIPLRKNTVWNLYNVVYNLANSMSFYNTIDCRTTEYKDDARRLAAYGVRLFNFIERQGAEGLDCEIIAGLLSPVYKGLGAGYNHDRSFGLIVYRLLDRQSPDGSWQTDPLPESAPDTQSEYLCAMYRATGAAIDGLRPMRGDASNTENAALSLV